MLLRSGMVANATGTAALSLEMPTGKACRIREVRAWCKAIAAENWKFTIDRKSILQLKFPSADYMLYMNPATYETPIMDEFIRRGVWPDIPVGEGETFGITAPGASNQLEVVYDLYDAADVSPSEPNGSKASVYRMFQVISNSGVRATAGDLALDQSDLDTQYPAFPGGDVVPPRTTMRLLGLFGGPATKGTGAVNGEYTTYLKMLADREDILDLSLLGMRFLSDPLKTSSGVNYIMEASRICAGSSNSPARIVVFDPPIEFEAGSELNVYATIGRTGAGADFVAGDVKLGMIFDVAKVG